MAKLGINTGAAPDDGTGDSLRVGAQKINSNFDELYSFLGDGVNLPPNSLTSIANTWGGSSVGIYTTKNVGIGTTNPLITLTVTGSGTSTSQLFVTGISTFVGFSTFQDYIFVQDGLTVTGTGVTSTTLRVSGVSTFVGFSTFNNNVYIAGVATVGSDFYVNGTSTFIGFSTFKDYVYIQDGLNVTGSGLTATSINANSIYVGSAVTINSSGIYSPSGIITASQFFDDKGNRIQFSNVKLMFFSSFGS